MKDVNVGMSARKLFDKHISDLSSSTCLNLMSNTLRNIDILFHNSLMPKVDHGVQQAVSTASTTVTKWGSKVCFSFSLALQY